MLYNISRFFSNRFILLLLVTATGFSSFGQVRKTSDKKLSSSKKVELQEKIDTFNYKFGLRIGIDVGGPVSTFLKSNEILYKGVIDARIYKDYFVAAEYGYSEKNFSDVNLQYKSSGYFTTIGGDVNFLSHKENRNDIFYFGIRYGLSRYKNQVQMFKIQNGYWLNQPYISSVDEQRAYAHWINARVGLKVEVLKNLYLGASLGINMLFSATEMNKFDNLYIPGFGQNRDSKAFQFNYTLMYMLPFN